VSAPLDLRVPAVTEPSPQAVFRHTDIHAPPPRDRVESSAIRVPQRNINQGKETVMNQKSKKRLALVGFVLAALCASSSYAADVQWKGMFGVITASDDPTTDAAENINNPIGQVKSASFAWSVRAGHARVNLNTGAVDFVVHGLVINGQTFSGYDGSGARRSPERRLQCRQQPDRGELDTSDVPIDARETRASRA
jgi:hypothetical protein